MKFDLVEPCPGCPFLREGEQAVRHLREDRVVEITSMMLDSTGGTFPCHKTVEYDDDDDDGDYAAPTGNEQHCAGALIFAEKNGNATQMMRIMERLHVYDRRKLEPYYDLVFDDEDEMLEAQES